MSDLTLDHDTQDTYLGVPHEFVLAVGQVALAGARVEDLVYQVAESALDIPGVRSLTVSKAADSIKDEIRANVPPWALIDDAMVREWIAEVKSALDRRNEVIHATPYKRKVKGTWVSLLQPTGHKTRERPLDLAHVERVADSLHGTYNHGFGVWRDLSPQMRPGVGTVLYGPLAGTMIGADDGSDRPDVAEREAWQARFKVEFADHINRRSAREKRAKAAT
ncbi:hypothetical protein [Cellulomonas sp.]|uniref:hypothetical protein n=1 Tax=Cellulomonas sp. TaxID=40001 RepID=UPI003BAC9A6F